MNAKIKGERAQNAVIGELAKWSIDVAIPLSDNYPFDFITIADGTLKKIQVKSSGQISPTGSTVFDLTTNDWYRGTTTGYTSSDCDIIICFDLKSFDCYLLGSKDFVGKNTFSIRRELPKNGQKKLIKLHKNYVISSERIKEIFGIDRERGFPTSIIQAKKSVYTKVCLCCSKEFQTACKSAKYCSLVCGHIVSRKCDRPSKEELAAMLEKESWLAIARKYNVTDNSIRKWAKAYGLLGNKKPPQLAEYS